MNIVTSHKRILVIAIAIGFVGGFSAVAVANGQKQTAAYSTAG